MRAFNFLSYIIFMLQMSCVCMNILHVLYDKYPVQ